MSQHNDVGKIGEELARKYLEKKGYKVLAQNHKNKYAEIDLVAEKPQGFLGLGQSKLVFVEVRTKIGEAFGSPEETLNTTKLQKVLHNALTYSAFKKWEGPSRIDAICIVLNPNFSVLRLTHHENIIS